jgi:hypothetical protein
LQTPTRLIKTIESLKFAPKKKPHPKVFVAEGIH